jgi:hypothetical protein
MGGMASGIRRKHMYTSKHGVSQLCVIESDLAVCRDVFSSIMGHSQISLVQSPSAVTVLLPMLSSEEAAHVRVALMMALALVKKYSQVRQLHIAHYLALTNHAGQLMAMWMCESAFLIVFQLLRVVIKSGMQVT